MIKSLHHTGFIVSDRTAALAFYRDVMGLDVVSEYERRGPAIDRVVGYQGTHLKSALLDLGGGHMLELIQYVSPPPAARPTNERNVIGAAHMALMVEDIASLCEKLVAAGAAVINPPTELAPGRLACYLQDPDGNWLELVQVAESE
jgi:catechol 2,3-dioxygenase-like lactoylglutathione lyase family enzyme